MTFQMQKEPLIREGPLLSLLLCDGYRSETSPWSGSSPSVSTQS